MQWTRNMFNELITFTSTSDCNSTNQLKCGINSTRIAVLSFNSVASNLFGNVDQIKKKNLEAIL